MVSRPEGREEVVVIPEVAQRKARHGQCEGNEGRSKERQYSGARFQRPASGNSSVRMGGMIRRGGEKRPRLDGLLEESLSAVDSGKAKRENDPPWSKLIVDL